MDLSSFKAMLKCLVVLTTFSSLLAQNNKYSIEHISIEQGLSHGRILCILQDSRSFIWIGTANGLNRYDGHTFKIYSHDPSDSLSISANVVHCLYEDSSNTLWVGTENGLNRFDHATETFTRFISISGDSTSLSGAKVADIFESTHDGTGALWIATRGGERETVGGLHKLDRKTGKFIRFQYDPNNPSSLSDNALRFILEDNSGNLWIGTYAFGLNCFAPSPKGTAIFNRYGHDPKNPNSLSSNRIWGGAKDKEGNLWFATFGGGVNCYKPQTNMFIHFKHQSNNPNSLFHDFVTDIFVDSYGMIWLGNGVLTRFNPQDETFVHIKFSENQRDWRCSDAPYVIYEDKSHNLWVGTRRNGIYKIDLKPQKFRHYVQNPGDAASLSDNDIQIIYEDKTGKIWIATRSGGLCRFNPDEETFTQFKQNPNNRHTLSNNIIYSICDDRDGFIWIGTAAGLNRINPTNNRIDRFLHEPDDRSALSEGIIINTIYEDRDGTIWIGTYTNGLYRFNKKEDKLEQFIIDPSAEALARRANDIRDIYEDRSGNLWISAWTGEYHFDRNNMKFKAIHCVTDDKNDSTLGRPLYEDRYGNLWGIHLGLNTVNPKTFQLQRFRAHPNPTREEGFDWTHNHPSRLYEDKYGMLWIGTRMGLHKFDPQQRKYIAHYYEKDGLLNNFVLKITSDIADDLWLLTGRGVSIFNESKPPGEQFRNLGLEEGIIQTPSSVMAFIKSKSGDIYWGGTNGIYRFYPEVKQTNPYIPTIQLTDFKLFNNSVKLDSAISEIKIIRLNYDENYFAFSFAALDFTNPKQNQYAYKLAGFDNDWVHVGNKQEANYTHVPPGEYTLQVIGSNNEDVWNQQGASVKIIIATPYWATWWFRCIILIILLGIGYSFHRYRLQKRREIERTRNRIARDLHDDVSSSLSSIALASELIENKDVLGENEKRLLTRIRTTSLRIMEAMDDIVWSVNPEYDKLDNLLLKMKDFAIDLFSKSHIVYSLSFPEQECLQTCHMNFRRNLFLIFKEILHNVVKHAKANHVEIVLTRRDGVLHLNVMDSGCGFNTNTSTHRNGLKNIELRAKEIGGTLVIQSQVNHGTKVQLTVKIP